MRSSEEDERGLRCRPRNKKRDKKPSLADWPAGSATHSRHPSLNWLRSRPTAESKCCECEPPEEEESSCFEGWHRLQHHAVLMEVATINFCREGWKLSQLSFIFDEPPCAVPCFPLSYTSTASPLSRKPIQKVLEKLPSRRAELRGMGRTRAKCKSPAEKSWGSAPQPLSSAGSVIRTYLHVWLFISSLITRKSSTSPAVPSPPFLFYSILFYSLFFFPGSSVVLPQLST